MKKQATQTARHEIQGRGRPKGTTKDKPRPGSKTALVVELIRKGKVDSPRAIIDALAERGKTIDYGTINRCSKYLTDEENRRIFPGRFD